MAILVLIELEQNVNEETKLDKLIEDIGFNRTRVECKSGWTLEDCDYLCEF